jgi:hypothetical protein
MFGKITWQPDIVAFFNGQASIKIFFASSINYVQIIFFLGFLRLNTIGGVK